MIESKMNSRDCMEFIINVFIHCGLWEAHAKQRDDGLVETSLSRIDSIGFECSIVT